MPSAVRARLRRLRRKRRRPRRTAPTRRRSFAGYGDVKFGTAAADMERA